MFAYVQIFKGKNNVSYGYVDLSFTKDALVISTLKGDLHHSIRVPIKEMTDIVTDKYEGWNQVKFTCNDLKYSITYSGYGGYDYVKNHLMADLLAES